MLVFPQDWRVDSTWLGRIHVLHGLGYLGGYVGSFGIGLANRGFCAWVAACFLAADFGGLFCIGLGDRATLVTGGLSGSVVLSFGAEADFVGLDRLDSFGRAGAIYGGSGVQLRWHFWVWYW